MKFGIWPTFMHQDGSNLVFNYQKLGLPLELVICPFSFSRPFLCYFLGCSCFLLLHSSKYTILSKKKKKSHKYELSLNYLVTDRLAEAQNDTRNDDLSHL